MTENLGEQADEDQILKLRAQLQFERDQFAAAQAVYKQQRVDYQEQVASLEQQLRAASELRTSYEARLAEYEAQRQSDEAQREDQLAYIAALEDILASKRSLKDNLVEVAESAGLRKKPAKYHPNYRDYNN